MSDGSIPLPPLRDVIEQFGLKSKKSFGQHFILDRNLTDKITRLAGDLSGVNVIEIGPGPGGLTRSLVASAAARVYAVEKDPRMIDALALLRGHAGDKLEIIHADALEYHPLKQTASPRMIIANLPYNVGTDMLIGWLQDIAKDPTCYQRLVLMFQKEVGERLAAKPGSKTYGRLSVLAQWLCEIDLALFVPASAFTPPPKVDSVVIRLTPRPSPAYAARQASLERVVATAFQQRRKMLRASLKPLGMDLVDNLPSIGIDPTERPEQLSVAQFCQLANLLDDLRA